MTRGRRTGALPAAMDHQGFWRYTADRASERGRRGLWAPRPGKWGALRLTTTGRRSGRPCAALIIGYYGGRARLVSMAMNGWGGGRASLVAEPAEADPQALVELAGGIRREVLGRAAVGEERRRLWQRWRELDKNLDGYAARRPRRPRLSSSSPHCGGMSLSCAFEECSAPAGTSAGSGRSSSSAQSGVACQALSHPALV